MTAVLPGAPLPTKFQYSVQPAVSTEKLTPTCSHWGNYRIATEKGQVTRVLTYDVDEEPSEIGQSLLDNSDPNVRIAQPMVRQGYLENPTGQPDGQRGRDPFIPVSWDEALDLAAERLNHFWTTRGPNSLYGGSYGWASAGRFHHAQSQIHRFLRLGGGYVSSVNSYPPRPPRSSSNTFWVFRSLRSSGNLPGPQKSRRTAKRSFFLAVRQSKIRR